MDDNQKKLLFKLWDKLGISRDTTKYLDFTFVNGREYFDLMQEYLGVSPDTEVGSNRTYFQNMEEYILRDVNGKFFSDNSVKPSMCGEFKLKLYKLNLERFLNSPFSTYPLPSSKLQADFIYQLPEDFECPDETDVEGCFDEYCLEPLVFQAGEYIKKTYGVGINYNMFAADTGGLMFRLVIE